jgi:hypothetical protein
MRKFRRIAAAIGLAAICAAGLAAQTQETTKATNSKVTIKGGKDVTVIGCLERRENGDYILTQVREIRPLDPSQYALITSDDLSKHVGERVEIRGKVLANRKGSVVSKTGAEGDRGNDLETKSTAVGTSGPLDMPFLGVKSMKTLPSFCH